MVLFSKMANGIIGLRLSVMVQPKKIIILFFSFFQSEVTHLKHSQENGSITIGFSVGKHKIKVRKVRHVKLDK
jgi:hypothetical protein